MSLLTQAFVLSLALKCQSAVAPQTILAIALHGEKNVHLDDHAISPPNRDGSRDYGLMQINENNFPWLGLDAQTALDPCRSIAAAVEVLTAYARYNTGKGLSVGENKTGLAYALRVAMPPIKTLSALPLKTPPVNPFLRLGYAGSDVVYSLTRK